MRARARTCTVAGGAWPAIAPVSPRQRSTYSWPSALVKRAARADDTNSGKRPAERTWARAGVGRLWGRGVVHRMGWGLRGKRTGAACIAHAACSEARWLQMACRAWGAHTREAAGNSGNRVAQQGGREPAVCAPSSAWGRRRGGTRKLPGRARTTLGCVPHSPPLLRGAAPRGAPGRYAATPSRVAAQRVEGYGVIKGINYALVCYGLCTVVSLRARASRSAI